MSRIIEGAIIRTSYDTGPYRVVQVVRDCTCPEYHDELNNGKKAKNREPHMHIVCINAYPEKGRDAHEKSYLNGFVEKPDGRITGCSTYAPDGIEIRDEIFIDGLAAGTQFSMLDLVEEV